MTWDPSVDDVARSLQAAASDAPMSPRAPVIRAAVLDEVDRPRPGKFAPAMLAVAAVVMLAVLVGVGAPAVGSLLNGIRPAPAPSAVDAPAEMPAKGLGSVDGKAEATETAPASASPSVEPSTSPAPAVAEPTAPAMPTPSPSPTESPQPGHVPIVLPTPPIPIPIPTLPAP
jgi:hypothetical protein